MSLLFHDKDHPNQSVTAKLTRFNHGILNSNDRLMEQYEADKEKAAEIERRKNRKRKL